MKKLLLPGLALLMSLTLAACGSNYDANPDSTRQAQPSAAPDGSTLEESNGDAIPSPSGPELVQFPENYKEGVLYTTVNRGNMHGEIYTSREAIEAVQSGQPVPSGTVITYEIYDDGELNRLFVMEKRTGWGAQYPPEKRNGEWEYRVFNPDGSVKGDEDLERCYSCHMSQENDDYMNRLDEMLSAELN